MGPWRAVRHALLVENVILINIFSPVYINVQIQPKQFPFCQWQKCPIWYRKLLLKLKVENPKVFSFFRSFYSQSLCTLFHIKLFAASLQKSVDRNFGSRSSSLEVQQKLLNQSRWGGPVRNPGLVSARATDHGEQNQLLLTEEGNLRPRFPRGHWKKAWDCCVATHTDKCAQEMKVLSPGGNSEKTFKWGCCHAAHA